MSIYGPFLTKTGIVQRAPHLIDLILRSDPQVVAYRLWLSRSLENAYGTLVGGGLAGTGGQAVLTAQRNSLVCSPRITRRGQGSVDEKRGKQTSFLFDVDDYILPVPPLAPEVPSDEEYLYARIQEQRLAGWMVVPAGVNMGEPYRGPILVIPPANTFGSHSSYFTMSGIAPLLTTCTVGGVPVFDPTVTAPLPLHIVLPRPTESLVIQNISAADILLVSYGPGMPMISVDHGAETSPTYGGCTLPSPVEIILASAPAAAGAVAFNISGAFGMSC